MRNGKMRTGMALVALSLAALSTAGAKRSQTHVETRVETTQIPAGVQYEFSRTVGAGRVVKVRGGKDGAIRRIFRTKVRDGKVIDKQLVREERTKPEPALMRIGSSGFRGASRGGYMRGRVLTMRATAYHTMVTGTGRTRTGMRAAYGVVAVDPRVIPLGSMVYVEGYGVAIAADTGGAIKGNRIDLCFDDHGKVNRFGVRNVRVHVLKSR